MISNTGVRLPDEALMIFRTSAAAACCCRNSSASLVRRSSWARRSETEGPLTRVIAGAMLRLVLMVLRPFAEPARRAFAALVLPPVLDGRAIFAPKGQERY